jgi:hypothetical protein
MIRPLQHLASRWVCLSACVLLIGCGGGDVTRTGQRAALDSFDLQKMTDAMAISLAGDAEVLSAFQQSGPLRVVVQPVVNRLTGEVIPRGQAEAFTARVRVLLSRSARERFTWVMNRDSFYRLRASELDDVDLGPSPDAIDPQYALIATFSSLTDEDPKRRAAYYLCQYELTDLSGRTVLWADKYEVKKLAVKGFLD